MDEREYQLTLSPLEIKQAAVQLMEEQRDAVVELDEKGVLWITTTRLDGQEERLPIRGSDNDEAWDIYKNPQDIDPLLMYVTTHIDEVIAGLNASTGGYVTMDKDDSIHLRGETRPKPDPIPPSVWKMY